MGDEPLKRKKTVGKHKAGIEPGELHGLDKRLCDRLRRWRAAPFALGARVQSKSASAGLARFLHRMKEAARRRRVISQTLCMPNLFQSCWWLCGISKIQKKKSIPA